MIQDFSLEVGDSVVPIDIVKKFAPTQYFEGSAKVVSIEGKIVTLDNGSEFHIGWLRKDPATEAECIEAKNNSPK